MAKAIALAASELRTDWLRSLVVCGCAAALIAAGQAFPILSL